MTTAVTSSRPTPGTIARATGMALGVAIVLNVILYFVATGAGWLPAETAMGTLIELVPVLIFTIVPSIIGALIYFGLTRRFAREQANRIFVIVASIALIVMAASPFSLPSPTFGTAMILEIMHLVVGLPVMYFLTKSS